jgi:hypothetical protein
MICEVCGNLLEDCECEDEIDYDIQSENNERDILETGYDGDAL